MNYYKEIKNELINNEINRKAKNYSINKSDLKSYYNVGKILNEAGKHYGEGIIKEYSQKLKNDLNKNYSVRSLYRMLKYYNFVSEGKLPTLSAKLSWSHYDEILRFYDSNKIAFYIKISEQQNLSVRQLREKIRLSMTRCLVPAILMAMVTPVKGSQIFWKEKNIVLGSQNKAQ